jgi:AbrB family looped-hinge helix DNA binding protein
MPSASLSSKGQVTIPKAIRDLLKVRTGDRVDFVVEDERVVVRPGTRDLRSLRGILHRPGRKPVSIEAMDAAIARLHGKRP